MGQGGGAQGELKSRGQNYEKLHKVNVLDLFFFLFFFSFSLFWNVGSSLALSFVLGQVK